MKIRTSFVELLAGDPDFISAEELRAGAELQARFEHLRRQRSQFGHGAIRGGFVSAREAFALNNTDENLAKLKEASARRTLYGNPVDFLGPLRGLRVALMNEIRSWGVAIVNRAIPLAQSELQQVIERENARCVEAIGRPFTHSDIVEAARQPIVQLQNLLRNIRVNDFEPKGLVCRFGYSLPPIPAEAAVADEQARVPIASAR